MFMEKSLTMPLTTNQQYDHAVASCRQVFLDKTRDYGTSWRVLRIISVVDQVFIKAQRIRTIQEKKVQKIGDSIASEFMGIVNYCVIGLIQLELDSTSVEDLNVTEVEILYNKQIDRARNLMLDKNHDYGEAWRDMSQESYVDLILVKLLRIRQILANDGKTRISEGIDANFTDMLNYAIFGLILIEEGKHRSE
jgi:Nucleotide modification associated domain 1